MDKNRTRAARRSQLQPIEIIDQGQPIERVVAGADAPCPRDNVAQTGPAFHLVVPGVTCAVPVHLDECRAAGSMAVGWEGPASLLAGLAKR